MMPFLIGISLSAACGFRIFIPLLGLSIAALTKIVTLAPEFVWLTKPITIMFFVVVMVLEVFAFYIPRFDNIMDALAVPLATIAGILCTLSVVTGIPPLWRWTFAILAGGSIVLLIQVVTTLIRATATTTTGGIDNNVIATAELGSALLITFLALSSPWFAGICILLLLGLAVRYLYQRFFAKKLREKL